MLAKFFLTNLSFTLFHLNFFSLLANTDTSEPMAVYVAPRSSFNITVNTGAPDLDAGDQVTWNGTNNSVPNLIFGQTAFLSIQSAVNAVCAEGSVFLAAGRYDEGVEIVIEKAVTVQGDGIELTSISGNSNGDMTLDSGEHRIMSINLTVNDKVSLVSLSIVDSIATSSEFSTSLNSGGAIYQKGGILELQNCSLSRNFAKSNGGAIYCDSSFEANHLSVINCEFSNNTASSGGAIHVRDGFFDIKGSLFRENKVILIETSGITGGALTYRGPESFIEDTQFISNTAEDRGGAIYQFGDKLNLTNVIFEDNRAETAGGLYSREEVMMENVQFFKNIAQTGGGMVNFSGAIVANRLSFIENQAVAPSGVFAASATGGGMENRAGFTVTHLIARGNVATFDDPSNPGFGASADGGGIANIFGNFTAIGADISNNTAESDGGGLYSQFGSISLSNSTISNNKAKENGGGIRINSNSARLLQCTISGNQTEADGGGLYDVSDNLELIHCTIASNSTTGEGGGIYRSGSVAAAAMSNSIIAGNTATGSSSDTRGDFTPAGVNFIGLPNTNFAGFRNGLDLSFASSSATSMNDLFTPLSNNGGMYNTHALVVGSPAIDSGRNNAIPLGLTTDQRGDGFVRIFNSAVDIGALEFGDKGANLTMNVAQILPNEDVVLEAKLIPGQHYALEYSDNLAPFIRIPSSITAITNTLQITDSGPPLTPTPPSQEGRRFYRVVKLP